MTSHDDQSGRFKFAAQQARQSLDQARHYFDRAGEGNPYIKKIGGAFGGFRRFCNKYLPGGERTFWIALGLVLLVLFVRAILPNPNAATGGRGGDFNAPQPVGVAAAKVGDIDITRDAQGAVTPLSTVTVRPQVSGQLVRVGFTEGQMVKAGDLLAQIDPRPYQAALDQARGQLARDQASLNNAQLDLKRDQALYAAQATSQQTLDTQMALVKQEQGVVMSDRANIESAAINLGYTRITSPITGRAGIRQVDVGNFISAGQTAGIVVVTQLQPMSVLFAVPEDDIADIMARLNAGAELEADAYNHDQTIKLATGKLSAMDSAIDPTTGTVKLRALFDNSDGILFPAQFVNIRLLVNTLHDQIVVPSAAIQRGSQGIFVYVVKPDNTVAMRTVIPGHQQGDLVAIAKGLNAGETVVVDGGDRLRDGMSVTIPSGQKVDAKAVAAQNATALPASGTDARAARRAKMMKICGEDIKKYCSGKEGFAVFQCMREKVDSLSTACQAAMKSSGGHRGGGGGIGGMPH